MLFASIASVLISATWAFVVDRLVAQRRSRDALMAKALEQSASKSVELKDLQESIARIQERCGRLELNGSRKF